MTYPRFTRLHTKLICLILGLIVLPLGIFGTLLFALQQGVTSDFAQAALENSVAEMADRVSQELAAVSNLTNLFYLDEALSGALTEEGAPQEQVLSELSKKYAPSLGRLHVEVTFVTLSGACYGATSPLPEALVEGLSIPYPNSVRWISTYDLALQEDACTIYAVRPLHARSRWTPVGTLVVSVKESELRKICAGYLSETQNAYLLDRNGNLLMAVDNQGLSYVPTLEECRLYAGTFEPKGLSRPQVVTYNTVNTTGWVLAVASDYAALQAPYVKTNQLFLSILVLYFGIAIVLSVVLSKRFVQPIRKLQSNIELVKAGNLDTMVPVTSGDEIGQLSEQYNEMLRRIKALLTGLMDVQQARHEAEMQALQAQINPHFIYNTLASIRFLVFAERNQEADRALLSLVNILRGTLSNPHALSTVGQEVKLLEDYIELQRISFSRTLTVHFDIAESVRACPICKLTLQPVAENAFAHGFAPGQDLCSLTIRARDLGRRAEITITDNGVGFDSTAFPPQRRADSDGLHTGLGLGNVDERLRLAFGQEYGLRIDSTPGKGTSVRIVIPKTSQEGDALVYDRSDRG